MLLLVWSEILSPRAQSSTYWKKQPKENAAARAIHGLYDHKKKEGQKKAHFGICSSHQISQIISPETPAWHIQAASSFLTKV